MKREYRLLSYVLLDQSFLVIDCVAGLTSNRGYSALQIRKPRLSEVILFEAHSDCRQRGLGTQLKLVTVSLKNMPRIHPKLARIFLN